MTFQPYTEKPDAVFVEDGTTTKHIRLYPDHHGVADTPVWIVLVNEKWWKGPFFSKAKAHAYALQLQADVGGIYQQVQETQ